MRIEGAHVCRSMDVDVAHSHLNANENDVGFRMCLDACNVKAYALHTLMLAFHFAKPSVRMKISVREASRSNYASLKLRNIYTCHVHACVCVYVWMLMCVRAT